MSYSTIDQAIANIEYANKKRQRYLDNLSRKIQPTEKDKINIGEGTEYLANVKTLINAVRDEINKHQGKVPPQATDLEESVLGAIIIESNGLAKVKAFLKPEHFYLEKHRLTYEAVLALDKAKTPVDMRTVAAQLRRTGKLEAVGGAYFVAEITSKVSSAANIEAHARIMIEYAIKRNLILVSAEVIQDAYDDTADCFDILDKVKKSVTEIEGWIK